MSEYIHKIVLRVKTLARWLLGSRAMREFRQHGLWYASMAVLLTLLGLGSYAYRTRNLPPHASEKPEELPAQAAAAPVQADLWTPFETPGPTEEPAPVFVEPLAGEVIGEYAPDALVWSQTLGQWQTHPAVDILGSPGEAVCACADGTVIDAYRDSLWGNVIVLEHADGLTSTYAGLNTLNMVTVGETVRAGETISAVGQSASCETELPAHLHFALERDGEPVALAALMPKNEE